MMKKTIALIMVLVVVVSFVGCNNALEVGKEKTQEPIMFETITDLSSEKELSSDEENITSKENTSTNDSEITESPNSKASSTVYGNSSNPIANNKPASDKLVTSSKPKPTTSSNPTPTTSSKPSTSKPNVSKPVVINPSTPTEQMLKKIESYFFDLVNEERAKCECMYLERQTKLEQAANIRAKEIASCFSHSRPNGEYWSTTLDELNYKSKLSSENINFVQYAEKFTGSDKQLQDIAQTIFFGFKSSKPHYEAMITPIYDQTGISVYSNVQNGIVCFYTCHLFGHLGT